MVSPSAAARNGKLADDAGDLALAQRIEKVAPTSDAAARPMGPDRLRSRSGGDSPLESLPGHSMGAGHARVGKSHSHSIIDGQHNALKSRH